MYLRIPQKILFLSRLFFGKEGVTLLLAATLITFPFVNRHSMGISLMGYLCIGFLRIFLGPSLCSVFLVRLSQVEGGTHMYILVNYYRFSLLSDFNMIFLSFPTKKDQNLKNVRFHFKSGDQTDLFRTRPCFLSHNEAAKLQ